MTPAKAKALLSKHGWTLEESNDLAYIAEYGRWALVPPKIGSSRWVSHARRWSSMVAIMRSRGQTQLVVEALIKFLVTAWTNAEPGSWRRFCIELWGNTLSGVLDTQLKRMMEWDTENAALWQEALHILIRVHAETRLERQWTRGLVKRSALAAPHLQFQRALLSTQALRKPDCAHPSKNRRTCTARAKLCAPSIPLRSHGKKRSRPNAKSNSRDPRRRAPAKSSSSPTRVRSGVRRD